MSVSEGALQIFQAFKSKLTDYLPDMTEAAVAVLEKQEGSLFVYDVTMIQGKILSSETVSTLQNLRKDIGLLILKKMNEYR